MGLPFFAEPVSISDQYSGRSTISCWKAVAQKHVFLGSIRFPHRRHAQDTPNYDKATIDDDKFLKYSLDMTSEHGRDKAIAYKRGLGYDQTYYQSLKQQIINQVNGGMASLKTIKITIHGVKYIFELPVLGPNGKTKTVVVVYQIDHDKKIPRLVTNYLK